MKTEMLSLLVQADAVVLNGKDVSVRFTALNGQPDNEVVRMSWRDERGMRTTYFSEERLDEASFNANTGVFQLDDSGGTVVSLSASLKGRLLTPADAGDMVYVLIQEGGTSTELYIHAHSTMGEAEDDRLECQDNGAYRTSDIIVIPDKLASLPGFYEYLEEHVVAAAKAKYPWIYKKEELEEIDLPEALKGLPAVPDFVDQLVKALDSLAFPSGAAK